jgi:glucose uptake protein GlcU
MYITGLYPYILSNIAEMFANFNSVGDVLYHFFCQKPLKMLLGVIALIILIVAMMAPMTGKKNANKASNKKGSPK